MNWRSLKVQVTLGALLFLVAGLWSLAGYANSTMRETLQRRLAEQQRATVRVLASNIESNLQLRMVSLQVAAGALSQDIPAGAAELQHYLDARPALQILFNGGLRIVGPDGGTLAALPRGLAGIGTNDPDPGRVRAALTQGVAGISSPYVDKLKNTPAFHMAVPVRNGQGKVAAALVGVVDLGTPNFLRQLGEEGAGWSARFHILDPVSRQVVAFSGGSHSLVLSGAPGPVSAVEGFAAGDPGSSVSVDPDGVEELVSSQRVPSTGWIAYLSLPTAVAYADIAVLQRHVLVAAVLLTVAMGMATWALLRRQLAPLADATRRISELSRGEAPLQPLPVPPSQETGQLIASFNRLVETLMRRDADLRASEERYRMAFETSPDAVTFTRLDDGRYMKVSAGFEHMLGWTAQEAIDRTSRDLGIWCDPAQRQLMFDKIARDGYCTGFEARFACKDGSAITALVSAHRIEVEGQHYLLSISRDISERKAAEEQLQKLSLAVEQSVAGIMITDTSGSIEYVNEAFARMKGYEREELVGQNIRMLRPAGMAAGPYAQMWDNLARGQAWKGESMRLRKDGSEFPAFSVVTPLRRPDGSISHIVTVTENVSEVRRMSLELEQHRHHLEELVETRTGELLEARRQADAANVAKTRFLANMSHEIRTPMNAIVGLAYMLRRDGVTPSQDQRLRQIESSGQHLLSVLSDILDLSKIEAGRMELEDADFLLLELVEDAVALIRPQAEAKGLRLECDCAGLPAWVCGDPTRLRQALINYLGNAVKFTQTGFVALRCHLAQERDDAVLVRFEVTDTGIGIPADKLAALFQSFEQGDSSTSRHFGGTGLGLAINSHLARMMGGEVGVSSALGRGSTFWLTAWLRRSRRIAPPSASPSAADALALLRRERPGARVMLAEDNAISAEVAADLLRDAGLVVDLASDGVEVVAKAGMTLYDLVLMDMQMPRMDGLQATRAIRSLPGWEGRPIIALTANVLAGDRRQCLEAGMNDFLGKPLKPDSLYRLLWRWLGPDASASPTDVAAPSTASAPLEPADAQAELERIAGRPDMDREQVLSFRHRAAKYLDLLRSLVFRHAQDMAQVAVHLEAGDAAEARKLAHALRGDAAVLGAARLMRAAGELEALLRQEADAPDAGKVQLAIETVREAHSAIAITLGLPVPPAAARGT
ncbi:MAG: PAS domain S-box protein [Burkholderiales bacterium]|nr:PAS domain S-box protein [Burkholderiales bacterium]